MTRLILSRRSCSGVFPPLVTAAVFRKVGTTWSYPYSRMISSARSGSPTSMSSRYRGAVTSIRSPSSLTSNCRLRRIRSISSVGTSMPSIALILLTRAVKRLPSRGAPALSSKALEVTSPHSSSSIRCRARAMPSSVVYSLMPFSNRAEESELCPRARDVFRTLSRANFAASNSSCRVLSVISLFSPPIMPARATGRFPSQITRFSGVSRNSFSSRVWMISPSCARRTMISVFCSMSRSKACIGCPISSST